MKEENLIILNEFHNLKLAGHLGINKTIKNINNHLISLIWNKM